MNICCTLFYWWSSQCDLATISRVFFSGAKSLMESFEQTVSADNLTTSEAKHTVEAMVNNVLSEAMMNLDKKRGGGSATGN